jgi:emericellamide synthase (highly reducing iterative type I polyketide synthase)
MSFAETASLPVVGTTVYYCLIDKARLRNDDKILVHSAAGAVGQAAISLAQYSGAEIFATAGNEARREFLQRRLGLAESISTPAGQRHLRVGSSKSLMGMGSMLF